MWGKSKRFLPINIAYYLHKLLFFLTTPLLVVMLYFYGDNEQYIDFIYIVALCVSCIFCWKDKDTLGALFILLGYWVLLKLVFWVPDEIPYQATIYTSAAGLSLYFFRHTSAKIVLLLTLFTVYAEYFWWRNAYENKPEMHYWLGVLAGIMWAKQLLFYRVIIADHYFGYLSGKTALDVHISRVLGCYFILVLLMIGEYFLRHLGGLTNLMVVYNHFSFCAIVLTAVTLSIIYMHYFYNQSLKYFKA